MRFREIVINQGQISKMNLPIGFARKDNGATVNRDYLTQFSLDQDDDVKISFYYRGYRIAERAAHEFRVLLSSDDGTITTDKLQALSTILRDAADKESFEVLSSDVVTIGGKKVLSLTGIWKRSRTKNLALFIDADGTGSAIQEVHYLAPEDKFESHRTNVMQALQTISWL